MFTKLAKMWSGDENKFTKSGAGFARKTGHLTGKILTFGSFFVGAVDKKNAYLTGKWSRLVAIWWKSVHSQVQNWKEKGIGLDERRLSGAS